MGALLALINGREDLGRSQVFWLLFLLVALGFFLYPLQASAFAASNVAYYLLNIPLALGLSLLWGYSGVLSFGQVAFFGIAGYVYGVIAGNLVGTGYGPLLGSLGGLALSALVAAVFGFFVFFARVQAWIVPVLTLVLALLLETFLGQTAGYQWRMGTVLLGGYNGMTGIPAFAVGGFDFTGYRFYYLVLVLVLACYFGARMFINSRHGKVLLAIREDVLRTELLGYDIRLWQLGVFVVAAMMAGLSGLLYVQWGNYISPASLGLLQAALPVIWVAVGGRNSLLAVMIATFFLNWFNYTLSSAGNQYALIITGALLVGVMVFFPRGIFVVIGELKLWRRVNLNPFGRRRETKAEVRQ